MSTMTFDLYLDGDEYHIVGEYTPGDPGQTSGPPENCWPPEASEFEIESITVFGIELTGAPESLYGRIQEAAEEKADEIYSQRRQDGEEPPEREE